MVEVPEVPESIAERKIIVYKSRVDPTIINFTAEKMKSKLFAVSGFSKPRPEGVRVVSVDKHFEPYILVNAKYRIDYCKTKVYTLDVDNETEQVKILAETFKPETVVGDTGESRKVIKLEADEYLSYEDRAYVILDKTGREIPPDQVPSAPSEDHPHKILKEAGKKAVKVEVPPRRVIEMVKARIVKRPPDADNIENELFQISEHAVIYSPNYEITFRNVKTSEEKTINMDGVTAKITNNSTRQNTALKNEINVADYEANVEKVSGRQKKRTSSFMHAIASPFLYFTKVKKTTEPGTPKIPPVEDTEAYVDYIDETIQDLPDEIFNKPEEDVPEIKDDFSELFVDPLEDIDEGNYEGAIEKLNRIKEKINEELVESDERQEIVSLIDNLIEYLETLL